MIQSIVNSVLTTTPLASATTTAKPVRTHQEAVVRASDQNPKDTEDQALAIMKRRVREVGLQGYANEQKAISKLTKTLQLLKKDAEGDVRDALCGRRLSGHLRAVPEV